MAQQWQARSIKAIFSRKHPMNHTRLGFLDSDSFTASSALNLEPQTAEPAEPATPSSSFCCLLLFCGEAALASHLASNSNICNISVPFSGLWVWFGSGPAWYKHRMLCASVAEEHWEFISNSIKLLHEDLPLLPHSERCQKLMDWDPSSPAHRHSTQPSLILFLLPQFILPVAFLLGSSLPFSPGSLLAEENKHHSLEQHQIPILQTLLGAHSIQLSCLQHYEQILQARRWHKTPPKVCAQWWCIHGNASNSSPTCPTGHEKGFMCK